jgi:hypothetical protein
MSFSICHIIESIQDYVTPLSVILIMCSSVSSLHPHKVKWEQ